MSAHRRIRIVTMILLCFGLSLSAAQARQIQLCGFSTQFADFVVIDATFTEGTPRLILPSSWIQFVPHAYLLMGMSPIIREPVLVDPNLYIGKFMLVNTPPSSFLSNPACAVDVRILNTTTNPALPTYLGTGAFLCFGGTSGTTFQNTLTFNLTTCVEPGFPGGGSATARDALASALSALPPSTLEHIMTRMEDEGLTPFGESMNE